MRHIEMFEIEQFRGIRNLKLEGLGEVNLLVGGNNSGKTSVLEAIDLHCHPLDILRLVSISKKRDSASVQLPTLDSLRWMFPFERNIEKANNSFESIKIHSCSNGDLSKTLVQGVETKAIVQSPDERIKQYQRQKKILEDEIIRSTFSSEFDSDKIEQLVLERDFIEYEMSGLSIDTKEVSAFDIEFIYTTISNAESCSSDVFTVTNSSLIRKSKKAKEVFPTDLITPIDHRSLPFNAEALSNAILAGEQSRIIELLSLFDENIVGIQVLATDGKIPAPFLEHRKLGFSPTSIFGDGVRRALTLALGVLNAKNGIFLLDEIETAVHVNALDKVFAWLVKACKQYNVQLFATTHSLEAIDSILSAFLESDEVKDNEDEWQEILQGLVTYRLVQTDSETLAKRFAGPELADLRYDFGQDVR